MKTLFPEQPAENFNEWIAYIREQVNLTKNIKDEKTKEKEV